jgi:hypothetical protein
MSNGPDQSDTTPIMDHAGPIDEIVTARVNPDNTDHEKMAPDPPTNIHSVMRLPIYVMGGFLALILLMGASLFVVWYNAYQETAQSLKQTQIASKINETNALQALAPQTDTSVPSALAIEVLRQEIASIRTNQGSDATYGSVGVDLLLGRIDRLEQKLARSQASLEALRALNQLSEATQTGAGYEAQLVLARAKILNIPLPSTTQRALLSRLDGLSSKAKSGLSSRTKLVMGFPDQARLAFVAAPAKGEKPGLGKEISLWLKQYVTIRRIDRKDDSDAASLIHAAELKVMNGELEAAMPLIAKLPETSRQALKPWTDEAMARIEADSLVHNLGQSIEAAVFVDNETIMTNPSLTKADGVTTQ